MGTPAAAHAHRNVNASWPGGPRGGPRPSSVLACTTGWWFMRLVKESTAGDDSVPSSRGIVRHEEK